MMPRPQFSLKTLLWLMAVVAFCVHIAAHDAIKNDRKQMEGMWRVVTLVVAGGETAHAPPDDESLLVTFDADGKWTVTLDRESAASGASTIDTTTNPRSIDFKSGDGTIYLGIYEFTDKVRQICFASPGHPRPSEFSSKPGSKHILMEFDVIRRVKASH